MSKPSSTPPDMVVGNWNHTHTPDFSGMSCFVLDGAWYGAVVRMMAACGFERANKIDEANVVVFTGGTDVDPSLYGEKSITATQLPDTNRDKFEKAIFEQCKKAGIPMFGICRGMQFLWAMNGGKLWQDVDNHGGQPHYIVDLEEDVRVLATSYHHQACRWDDELGATLLAMPEDNVATKFVSQDNDVRLTKEDLENYDGEIEVEAAYFESTKCFLVQGHPEVGSPEFVSWTMTKLFELLLEWEEADSDIVYSSLA